MGEKNTGGYTIGIERVVETEKYNYQRKENNPEPDSMVTKDLPILLCC
jgi:hypothetical protein